MPQGSSAVRPTNGLYLLPYIHTHTHTHTHAYTYIHTHTHTHTPDHRPATYWAQHTTSYIAQSNAPEDEQNFRSKHVELIWIYQ